MSTFDTLAPTYDRDFTESPIARYLRERTHERLDHLFNAGDCVLELGCGTGEDAIYLARRGVRVIATDSSEAMLAAARVKTANEPRVRIERFDLNALPNHLMSEPLDGTFSNFGALNCLCEWRTLAAWLAARIKPRGKAAFGVMSPACLWEMAWHGLHGDFKTAGRRLRGQATFKPDSAADPIPIYYPSPRHLARDFAPYFRLVAVRPLGLFLPPSDVYGVIEKRPALLNALLSLERRFGGIGALARFADHYWIEFERSDVRGEK